MTSNRTSNRTKRDTPAGRQQSLTRISTKKKMNSIFFETLPVDDTILIAGCILDSSKGYAGDNMNAIHLLETGGTLADGSAVAFGSWLYYRLRHTRNFTEPEEPVFRMKTVGKSAYKATRRFAPLLGVQLHTLYMPDGITWAYVNILNTHARGLRELHVCEVFGDSMWIPAILESVILWTSRRSRCTRLKRRYPILRSTIIEALLVAEPRKDVCHPLLLPFSPSLKP